MREIIAAGGRKREGERTVRYFLERDPFVG